MANLVNITKFRWWANKVLPAVYDDSLSYYEVLTKMCAKLDEIIDNENEQNKIIENLPTDVSQFAEMLEEFKTSMETEFDTFTDAINASIEEFESEVNEKIVTDTTPTENSQHLVTSGGVYASIKAVTDSLVKDTVPTANSHNYVESGGVYSAINDAINNLDNRFNAKQDKLNFDTTPTENSNNPVYSGGIYTALHTLRNIIELALNNKQNTLTWDNVPTLNSNNPVTSDGIANALDEKQDTLVFDNVPTEGSTNPVTSDGIRQAIDDAIPEIPIDNEPTEGSNNAVSSGGTWQALVELAENIDNLLSDKQDVLTWDILPVENSLNPVTSGGVWEAIARIAPSVVIDAIPTEGSAHAVSSGGTYDAVQAVITNLTTLINQKQNNLTWDSTPTLNSLNPVTSDGIRKAIDAGGGGGGVTIDPTPTEDSPNAVSSGGVYDALAGKQDTLTFDDTPTQDSTNPVKSSGVYSSIATLTSQVTGKQNKITTSNHWHSLPIGAVNWVDNQYYYTYSHNTGDRTIIDIDPTQTELWAQFGVYAYSESNNYILFKCKEVPSTALQFKITTMDVLKISD